MTSELHHVLSDADDAYRYRGEEETEAPRTHDPNPNSRYRWRVAVAVALSAIIIALAVGLGVAYGGRRRRGGGGGGGGGGAQGDSEALSPKNAPAAPSSTSPTPSTCLSASTRSCSLEEYLKEPFGNVLLMRHALAPGGGDPSGFKLNDCSTQRNLNSAGLQQATNAGKLIASTFSKAGVPLRTSIYTSQWCRCRDTATQIANVMGNEYSVVEEWGLNSFYQPSLGYTRDMCVTRLNDSLLAELDRDDSRNATNGKRTQTLLVTHYVTLGALSGITTSSGGVVALDTRTRQARELTGGFT
ncbi:phosphoglycerate mutase [Pseudoscourfieldia marina]